MTATFTSLDADGFHLADFNAARPFAGFLPSLAGARGKPLWAFYANRGQCIASFGVRDRDGAMLEFHPANKAYALTPLLGFRTFFRLAGPQGPLLHEPFLAGAPQGVTQQLVVRPAEIELVETHPALGLRVRVAYFTLAGEDLPALVRSVRVDNIGAAPLHAEVLDGLPQIVPYGLEEKLQKSMSRTMEAFAEVLHVEAALPFYKLKVEPSDKPGLRRIESGFFAFTLCDGAEVGTIADPDLVFGRETSLRTPAAFLRSGAVDARTGRHETLTACAFAQLALSLEPGACMGWDSLFGAAPDWEQARALRARTAAASGGAQRKRDENRALVAALGERFAVVAGPPELDPYSRQTFIDNTLRGGEPVVVEGPRGPRVFHAFTRKHGDMERDYNAFELSPGYWSQGSANFRDVNQNRRSEHFTFAGVGGANLETFFGLLQIDGNNPLVVLPERFRVAADERAALARDFAPAAPLEWQALLERDFSPGELLEALLRDGATAQQAQPDFERILGRAEVVQDAAHGEGYWVDHWIYNLDLLESVWTLQPDRMRALLVERRDFAYHDCAHAVQSRARKYRLRDDGTVRQFGAVALDPEKARLIAARTPDPQLMRAGNGTGPVYRTSLLAKLFGLVAVKATLLDPSGIGLEMEADKPGWCDALNGLPGMFGSSTHEAFALRRAVRLARRAVTELLPPAPGLALPVELADLADAVSVILAGATAADDFFPIWDRLAGVREAFRERTRLGVAGDERDVPAARLRQLFDTIDGALARGLARGVDTAGLPVSYYTHELVDFDLLAEDGAAPPQVRAHRFVARALPPFLEGSVHALRSAGNGDGVAARALHRAVRGSLLYDWELGMYRVNAPLDGESLEIGRIRSFTPGWLENESVFLHMHYKFLLEMLRSGLAEEFFDDLRRGLVAFRDPAQYGRSPLENSSFIASSRFADADARGAGFVARLSGATAEWISMVLHMGLGAAPFRLVGGALRFEPEPTIAGWLFTERDEAPFAAGSFGFRLFGSCWIVFANPQRHDTFGAPRLLPSAFELAYRDGRRVRHAGSWLPEPLALDLRAGLLARVDVALAEAVARDQPAPATGMAPGSR